MVSSSDMEGDQFTTEIDSAYKFLKKLDYTDTEPGVKTMKFVYKPDYTCQGTHRFSFTGTDEYNNISKSVVSVTVKNINRVPVPVVIDTLRFKPYGNYKMIQAGDVFTDPDNDMEQLEGVTANSETLDLYNSGNSYLCLPMAAGITSVTFMVTDKYGAKATSTIPVLVSEKVTGIDPISPAESSDVILYPNPTKGLVHAILPSELNGKVSLTILNTLGAIVKQEDLNVNSSDKTTFNLSDLPVGIYFLKFNNSSIQKTAKVLKN
jgi:hypothetical protein